MRIDELAAAMAELPEGHGFGYPADLADPAVPESIHALGLVAPTR